MSEPLNVYIIKLVGGESILACISELSAEKDTTQIISYPMKVEDIQLRTGECVITPWIPFGYEQHDLALNKSTIILMTPVGDDVAGIYEDQVDEFLNTDGESEAEEEEKPVAQQPMRRTCRHHWVK
jgi:hypothetical protein